MAISFSYADRKLPLTGKNVLKQFIKNLFELEGVSLDELSYVFCSDEYLLQMNRQFLNHDYYTDIISFDLRSSKADPMTGEIYISVDRVRDNSQLLGTNFTEEAKRVIFHGALHLCGYKDKTKREISAMREREDHYLRLFDNQFFKRST